MLSNNPLNINGTGNTAQTTISETNYAGTFSTLSTCDTGGSPQPNQTAGPIATLSSGPYSNGSNITVTANEAGTCMVTFTDSNGLSVTLTINVTTTSVTVNGKKPVTTPRKNPTSPAPAPGVAPIAETETRVRGEI